MKPGTAVANSDLEAFAGDQRLLDLARSGAAPAGMGCADLHKLTLLSMLMTDRGEDDILALAAATLPALAPGAAATFHLLGRGWWPQPPDGAYERLAAVAAVDPRVPTLLQSEPIHRYALPVRSLGLAVGHLPVTRGAEVVCLAGATVDWQAVLKSVRAEPAGGPCWIGVGGICRRVADFPVSLRQARQALGLADRSGDAGGLTVFDDLGVYRLLATSGDPEELDRYVQQWLGHLLEQDPARSSDLVRTLAEYLHSGGSIAATAEKLNIHRSTVKYRLQRIRDVSALDLSNPATVFALQLAVHALETRNALFSVREDS